MATKTWKLGEVCRGGIITVITTKTKVTIIGKQWDFDKGSKRSSDQSGAKEFTRCEADVNGNANATKDKLYAFLRDLTTSYHSGQILDWIETKVEFVQSHW